MNVEKSKLDDCMSAMTKAQDLLDKAIELMNEVLEDEVLDDEAFDEVETAPLNTRTIKIHDLRKDPTDLPENSDDKRYLVWNDIGMAMFLPYYNGFNCFSGYSDSEITRIIAWVEIPKL